MPSGGDLVITVPSVNAYCKKLHSGLQSTIANDYGPEMSGHILADVDHASNPPTIVLFCNMHVFTANGLAFAANDVSFNFSIVQKAKLFRENQSTVQAVDLTP